MFAAFSWSVCENLNFGHVNRRHRDRSVLTTSDKIFTYRLSARLVRAKTNKI